MKGTKKVETKTALIAATFLLAPVVAVAIGLYFCSVINPAAAIIIAFASGMSVYVLGCWLQVQARRQCDGTQLVRTKKEQ